MEAISDDGNANNACSYAAGWATCKLPGRLQGLGVNSKLAEMEIIGLDQTKASRVYWNQGVHSGSNCFIALLPETRSAVIVLTNTSTGNDAADLIGQFLLEVILGNHRIIYFHYGPGSKPRSEQRKDHEEIMRRYNFSQYRDLWGPLAKLSFDNARKQHPRLISNFNFTKGRNFWGSSNRPLDRYMGVYASRADKRITLIVRPETYENTRPFQGKIPGKGDIRTTMKVQFANNMKAFTLQHLYNDSFTWYEAWNWMVACDKPTGHTPDYYILHFHPYKFDKQRIGSVSWWHDPELPEEGETFDRVA
ncbi:hypothetical protein ACQKWADRAFT_296791 [Trichoderma austrokoningii]